MIKELIKAILPGAGLLQELALWGSILGALSGALLWAYSAVKAQGAAEVQAERLQSDYATLQEATGAAIARLNEQHARDMLAASARQRDGERIAAQSATTIATLQQELDDARKNGDKCLDVPLPASRAQRLRELAKQAGNP